MTLYFYVHTDNRIDLDRLRRSAALAKELQKDFDIYFMTTEFRSATYAKRELGLEKTVGIEDFRNIGNICERGDIIIYDSDEQSEEILQEMIAYFGKFFKISYDPKEFPREGAYLISPHVVGERVINGILIDEDYFGSFAKSKRVFFYGDADYARELEKIAPHIKDFDFELLEGFYFFVDSEEKLRPYFKEIHEYDAYKEIIQQSSLFVTASPQSALEAAATGAKVVTMQKADEEDYLPLLQKAGIVDIGFFDAGRLQEGIIKAKEANIDYLRKMGVEKVAQKIKELIK